MVGSGWVPGVFWECSGRVLGGLRKGSERVQGGLLAGYVRRLSGFRDDLGGGGLWMSLVEL